MTWECFQCKHCKTRRAKLHKTTVLRGIEIDEGMGDLIVALWNCGYETSGCCIGYACDASVNFMTMRDAKKFFGLLSRLFKSGHEFSMTLSNGSFPPQVDFDRDMLVPITQALRGELEGLRRG